MAALTIKVAGSIPATPEPNTWYLLKRDKEGVKVADLYIGPSAPTASVFDSTALFTSTGETVSAGDDNITLEKTGAMPYGIYGTYQWQWNEQDIADFTLSFDRMIEGSGGGHLWVAIEGQAGLEYYTDPDSGYNRPYGSTVIQLPRGGATTNVIMDEESWPALIRDPLTHAQSKITIRSYGNAVPGDLERHLEIWEGDTLVYRSEGERYVPEQTNFLSFFLEPGAAGDKEIITNLSLHSGIGHPLFRASAWDNPPSLVG
jgi:hypothetical protein